MIGTILLNRYEILEKIGEGGMGIVYKAKCHLLNRFVAVKILKKELSNDEDFVARFKQEANSVASLSHPNIVNVYDVGTENQINFIVMEYINGQTLKQIIKADGRLSSKKAIEIALQIAKALECAHKHNIIHRDVKPDNIMITEDNIVKVMDFGIAKVADSCTITNKVMGSANYFSPEQAKGIAVDFRTDIYSLGIVMYEMVTGRVPYSAESSIMVAIMHIQESITPPKEVINDIPENINQVILKAVEKEPIKRYQTAKEMADVLSAIKEDFGCKVNFNNRSNGATMIMDPAVSSDAKNDFTMVISRAEDYKKPIIKKDRQVLSENGKPSKNKKIMIITGAILLVIMIAVLGRYLSRGPSTEAQAPSTKTTIKLPTDEKKLVPSLIGNTQDIANQTIVSNGFLLGSVSNDYSDSVAKGLVISQSPVVNTSYEKGGEINLIISLGQKNVKATAPKSKGKKTGK